jgi:hypothetical protein
MAPKNIPLLPKATAIWLIDNTSLTFGQIAEFCEIHPLEVQGIADGDGENIMGVDPILANQITRKELDRCMADAKARLQLSDAAKSYSKTQKKTKSKYTPIARRQDKPNAVLWIVKNHPELSDAQIVKLIGTTKNTIQSIRQKTHWNISNIKPQDPVLLGVCTQSNLDALVEKVRADLERNKSAGSK